MDEWRAEYEEYLSSPPEEGDQLTTEDGGPIRLEIELAEGQDPFIFTRCYLPSAVGAKLCWYVQGLNSRGNYGWKCILMSQARTEAIRRYGLGSNIITVQALRVVRKSNSGRAYLVTVERW